MNIIQLTPSPEECYALGFIWADGCITKTGTIRIEIVKDDAEVLRNIFTNTVFNMKCKDIYRTGNRKPSILFHKGCKQFCSYLEKFNYREKTKTATIIPTLPSELQKYWWRGYSDGDGCFYAGQTHCQYSITGPYDQDWQFAETLFRSLDISFQVARISNQTGKKSYIKTGKYGGSVFGRYIYDGYDVDRMGLLRKYNKYEKFI